MALNTTRTAPQKSFGRRPGAEPQPAGPAASRFAPHLAHDPQTENLQTENLLAENLPAENLSTENPFTENPSADNVATGLTAFAIVKRSLAVIADSPVTFLALVAACALSEQFLAYLPISAGAPSWLVLPVFTTLGCAALYAAAFGGAMLSLKGEKVNFDLCLRAAAKTPAAACGFIAVTVSSFSLMLIIPGITFARRWALAAPVAIVEGRDARARSEALTAPCRAPVRRLILLIVGLTILRGFAMVPFSSGSIMDALTSDWLFSMLLTVFAAVAGAVLYRELADG